MPENNPQDENNQKDQQEIADENTSSEQPQAGEPKAVEAEQAPLEKQKLCRSRTNKVLGGVAGGIAEYLGVDPNLIRLVFVLLTFFGGAGVPAYIIAWIIIPECGPGPEETAEGTQPSRTSTDIGLILGIALVGLGIWFLLQNLNLIPGPFFVLFRFIALAFWPGILILIGIFIIVATSRGRGLHISTAGKTLYRSRANRMIAGVAGGLGDYFGIDPIIIRLVWATLIFTPLSPAAIIAYIIMAIVIPEAPEKAAS